MSRVGRELSPGVTPPVARTARGTESGPSTIRATTTVNIEEMVIPARIPVTASAGRTAVGDASARGLTNVELDVRCTALSTLLLPAAPAGSPTTEGVEDVIVVFLSPAPYTVVSDFLSGSDTLFYERTAEVTTEGTAAVNALWGPVKVSVACSGGVPDPECGAEGVPVKDETVPFPFFVFRPLSAVVSL